VVSCRIRLTSFALAFCWLAILPVSAAPPLQPLSRVRELARTDAGTPVTVRGVVTRYRAGRSLAIQDQSGSIFVYTEDTIRLVPGDVVEVTGLAGLDEANAPSIEKASYVKVGTGEPPKPIAVVAAAELARGRHESDLVSVEGTLVRVETGRYEYGLVTKDGDVEFTSWVLREEAGGVAALPAGSRVRLTGVASLTTPTGGPQGFELLMRNGADVVVLQPPSWWTLKRVSVVATALGGAVALLFTYVLLLRRQVGRHTATLRDKLRAEGELKEQYRQAQKMEAVGRLAGGIAHDFNNIMTVVLGHSELLALELKDNTDMRTSVVEIQHAAERAASLTRQLLAFSRRQKLDPAPVDLNLVAADMVALLSRVLGGEIEVHAETGAEPVTIATDRAQLEQALLNLAVNARDAMPEGGRLVLTVSRRPPADGGGEVGVMQVADTGSGIPLDVQAHIFDPFFTTKEVGRGSGLGLAMVYGFVQQSGGTIHFDTAIGKGTTFELTFPLATPAAPAEAATC
jgi:signal transduction histidine kinase